MKKKRFLANIITLVFAISVMSFGIYAAYSASLTMTGTVGFVAHECEVEVLGTITNAIRSKELNFAQVTNQKHTVDGDTWYDKFSELDAEENPTNTPVAIANENVEWVFGDIYFDDIYTEADGAIQDVIITLQVTNKSVYPIVAEININDIDVPEGMTFDAPPTTDLAVNETKDIVMTVSLVDDQAQNTIEITTVSGTSLDLSNCVVTFNKAGGTTGENPETPETPENPETPEVPEGAVQVSSGWVANDNDVLTGFPTLEQNGGSTIANVPTAVESTTTTGTYNNVLTLGSTGSSESIPNANLYTNIVIPEGVNVINYYAFKDCTQLQQVTIPSTTTAIYSSAFSGCENLQTVYINSENITTALTGGNTCGGLIDNATKVYVSTSITNYNALTFEGFELSEDDSNQEYAVYIPAVEDDAGEDYVAPADSGWVVTEAGLLTSFPTLEQNGGSTTIRVPKAVELNGVPVDVVAIGDLSASSSVTNASLYTNISLPNIITTINNKAFQNCTNLTTVNLTENSQLKKIGNRAFYGCAGLSKIIMPNSLTYIGQNSFYNCNNLIEITIPSLVTTLGVSAFENCTRLTTVNLASSISLVSTSEIAFKNCNTLTTVNIDKDLTQIGDYIFYNCSSITTVNILENSKLEIIGEKAFYKCSNLTKIMIPNTVTAINSSFLGCSGLLSVYVNSLTIVNKLTSNSGYAALINNAKKVYISTEIANHDSLTVSGFTYSAEDSDSEYSCYIK